jgi:hypothetical protein
VSDVNAMNAIRDMYLQAPARVLDRLVDGELNEAERREVLLLLEEAPEGWRRCALAFLENQAWGNALPSVAKELTTVPVVAKEPWYRHPITTWATALAASLLFSFGIGGWTTRGFVPIQTPSSAAKTSLASQVDPAWLEANTPQLPAAVIAELQDAGITVKTTPRLVPSVELNYVGSRGL